MAVSILKYAKEKGAQLCEEEMRESKTEEGDFGFIYIKFIQPILLAVITLFSGILLAQWNTMNEKLDTVMTTQKDYYASIAVIQAKQIFFESELAKGDRYTKENAEKDFEIIKKEIQLIGKDVDSLKEKLNFLKNRK